MDVIHQRCCGLDIHKKSISACVIISERIGRAKKHMQVFGTMTRELLELADWLRNHGVTHAAMEATGVYWKPVWNVLEGCSLELMLVNPQHVKALPGRKTDQKDAEWLAAFCAMGFYVPASFLPLPSANSEMSPDFA